MEETEYLSKRLDNQIDWYDKKSKWNQNRYKLLRILEISFGALIPILTPFISDYTLIKILIATLGGLIAVIIGVQGIYNFHENWLEYRMIAETLKHEKFLYATNSGPYDSVDNAFKNLVSRIESVISHENINWSQLNKSTKGK